MDRIRKALDFAREERNQAMPVSLTPSPAPTPPPAAERIIVDPEPHRPEAAAAEPRRVLRVATSIVYTQTRVFEVSERTLEANRIVNPAGNEPAAAAFRMLRTQVLQRLNEHQWRSMAILSPGSNDGKTTTAINLALSLANDQRHTVLLVDCDLRRPAVARMMGLDPEFGVDDVLKGDARVEQALYHPADVDRLVILPARAALPASSDWLAGPSGRALVNELRGRYPERIVLYDLPPLLGSDDALAFLPMIECGLMVASEGGTRREDLLRCMELTHRTPLVGTVLNRASDVHSGYG